MREAGPVTILHAFSRRNAGDGLLVDLTYNLLAEVGVPAQRCQLLALDPDSFTGLDNVFRAPGEKSGRLTLRAIAGGAELLASTLNFGSLAKVIRGSSALVAVGGGYLVADSPYRQAGVALNHLAPLLSAARFTGPTIYLPQSIGPLKQPISTILRPQLARLDRIWLRDDESMAEIHLPNCRRVADLAVLQVAMQGISPAPCVEAPPVIVARELPDAGSYLNRIRALVDDMGDVVWAVQADVPGPRSDAAFYKRISVSASGPLAEQLQHPGGPVISVRLHGAISAILAGRPAIHLAYERKGWGAFQDLGLDDFVHDARDFDPQLVARQARELTRDPNTYWRRVEMAKTRLRAERQEIVSDLAARLSGAA